MIQRVLEPLQPRNMPLMTRQSYRHELVTAMTMPVAQGLAEGGFIGVLADKVFDAPRFLLALVVAAPMAANLSSLAWARLAHGRRRIRFIGILQVSFLLTLASIALVPRTVTGAWIVAGLIVLARCLLSGIITHRSTVWRMNYPRHLRGRITSRLALLTTLIIVATTWGAGWLLDYYPGSFRVIYPLALLIGLIGVVAYSRVRLRGERDMLRYEMGESVLPAGTEVEPALGDGQERVRYGMVRVLRNDPVFRRYMLWQFFAGVSNMMVEPPLVDLVSRQLDASYGVSVTLTTAIPMLLATVTLPFWARLLDRVHISQFRVRQSSLWVVSQALTWVGAMFGSLLVLGLARFVLGIARGGGMLAWNLGHHDFASRRMASVYMGVHSTLTGIRGMTAPFIGMALYAGWPELSLPGVGVILPAFDGIGRNVFLIAVGLSGIAGLGFLTLHRRLARSEQTGLQSD